MNTKIVTVKDGQQYNDDGQEVIICIQCNKNLTTMTGTKLCDFCWEDNRREMYAQNRLDA